MSQSTPEKRTLGSYEYSVYMLPPLEAHDMLVDLGVSVLPSLGNVFAAFVGTEDPEQSSEAKDLWEAIQDASNPDQMAKAFESLAVSLAKNKGLFRDMIDKLSRQTMVRLDDDREPRLSDVFNTHFRGQLPAMYKWLAFALEVQFGNFSELVGSVTGLSARKTPPLE